MYAKLFKMENGVVEIRGARARVPARPSQHPRYAFNRLTKHYTFTRERAYPETQRAYGAFAR
ncbi:hypothetical protein AGR13a_Lc30091 [Agrobacterium genomosp. 13 str. CFBP 6927]|uniref:Uncharacterized protein n=1 Tax=Agrobacterium genomosp. 13 str. CFBP 6927 TaxID=1183428 RepID=A0ABP2BQ02_9HYPH|nr:hypothetical protein AGR13a_Lc30091 [Agrobacterium genomosp. 13 str. CFBP 6927]